MRSREGTTAQPQLKRTLRKGKDATTSKNQRRSSCRREGHCQVPPNASLRCIEDTDLPVVMTSDGAKMRILERLSTYKSHNGQPHFLPAQVIETTRVNVDSDFGALKLNGRKVFLLGPDLGAIAPQLRRRGAQLYDLVAAASAGFETLDHCLATAGADGALEFFKRAEQYFKRHVPEGFRLSSDGVYRLAQSQGPEPQEADLWLCSPISVKAYTRDHQNQNWGKLIEFLDKDGNRHRCLMPMSALAGHGKECWTQLLSHGLQIARNPKVRELVISYISDADPEERIRWSSRLGWHGDAGTFVLPDESIGVEHSEPILYQNARNTKHWLTPSCTLEDWINKIGRFCPGNPRLVFAASAAFAPPLLRLTSEPSGGFNFCGASSTGKTTALQVAASVWGGGRIPTWRMTANSLDGIADNHNDGLLCLDELVQADPREIGAIVYALANGSPKQRLTQGPTRGWSLLILSSGETSLDNHMRAGGKHVWRGQEVRLCDLDADAGKGLGLFEFIHGFANSSEFARHLAESIRRYYGTPIRAFLRMLAKDREATTRTAIGLRDQFLKRHVSTEASGEVRRAASRFALVAAAGELATAAGITGWQEGDSMYAAQVCFESWLGRRGTTVVDTPEEMIKQVRRFLETQVSPKIPVGTGASGSGHSSAAGSRVVGVRLGRDGDCATYLVDPDVFRRDVCAGFDPKAVLRNLKVHGFLEHDQGRLDKSVRLPGAGKTRVYAITAGILEGRSAVRVAGSGDTGDNGDNSSNLPKARKSKRPRSGDSGDAGTALTTQDTTAENPEAVEPQLLPTGDSTRPIGGSPKE